ncbi:MAG: efflux RND transporter periplasmic adaptor subunit [Bdellovibrionales bacterium]
MRLKRPTLPKLKIRLPKLQLPNMRRLKLTLPQLKPPKITVRKITLPRFKLPTVRLSKPTFKIPVFKRPTWPHINFSRPLQALVVVVILLSILNIFITGIITTNGSSPWGLHVISSIKTMQFPPIVSPVSAGEKPDGLNAINPAAGLETEPDYSELPEDTGRYQIENKSIEVEAVLIPHDTTVISSSQDSKIISINFDNGETFKKGDVLVEYDCKDVRAEVEIAKTQQQLTAEKSATSYKLFKLDIISNIEKLELESENKQAEARIGLYTSRMESCFIRAEYDGRVVKRLANAGEFTRTDRVLMEVASLDYLKAEFLLPSRWLRWVNVGAPINIALNETDTSYNATIQYIYGEVDPVSQSIQMTAQLDNYQDRLLPGMSGKATIDIGAIRDAGIYGYLDPQSSEEP